MHAVRLIIANRRVVYLGADCPEDDASDAAERLIGTSWCSHLVCLLRERLAGGAALKDEVLMGVLWPVSIQCDEDRKEKQKYVPWVPNDDALVLRLWRAHVERSEADVALAVSMFDGVMYVLTADRYSYGRALVVATKQRGYPWMIDDVNAKHGDALSGVGRQRDYMRREYCLVCQQGPYKNWNQHARGKGHQTRALTALCRAIAGLNHLPSLERQLNPEHFMPGNIVSDTSALRDPPRRADLISAGLAKALLYYG